MASRLFGGATTDRVDIGSAAALDNLAAVTVLLWLYPTALSSNRVLVSKGTTSVGWNLRLNGTGGQVRFDRNGSTLMTYQTSTTPLVTLNKWYCMAATYDFGVSPQAHIYTGDLTARLAEETYGVATNGVTPNDDSASPAQWGNISGSSLALQGRIAVGLLLNRALTLGELRSLQYDPRVLAGCLDFKRFGAAATEPDFSGHFSAGTVTGTAIAPGVPLRRGWRRASQVFVPYAVASGGNITMSADPGSYTITGTAAALEQGYEVAADPGAYAITGTEIDVDLVRYADFGEYVITGTSATLFKGVQMSADPGTYAITGTAAALERAREVNADAGAIVITGTAANLEQHLEVVADAGSYAISGTAADLRTEIRITADAGSYVVTGVAAGLLQAWKVGAGSGAYTITGTAATLTEVGQVTTVVLSARDIADASRTWRVDAPARTWRVDAPN